MFAGKTTLAWTASAQMCEVTVTEFGSSKGPRETALYFGPPFECERDGCPAVMAKVNADEF